MTMPLWAVDPAGREEEGPKGGLRVQVQNDLISVNVVNYPLRTVLDEITRQTGLKITIFGPLEERISVRLDDLSVDKALSKVIGNRANFVFYYAQKTSDTRSSTIQLAEVKVYPQQKGEMPALPTAVTPAVSKPIKGARIAEGPDRDKLSEELQKALKSQDGEVRESAAYALADVGDKKAVEPLIKSLNDDNSWVRESAAHALAEIGDKRAVKPLIKSLNDDNSWVRESAARALGELRDDEAIEPLKRLLNDEDRDVRESVSEALKKMAGGGS